MKFGIYVPNFGEYGDANRLAMLAREAEDAGWDGFFMWDHIARPFATDVADPWIALAAIAVATQRIRLGALVTPLARRRPWKVARETASLDRLCGGRLVFGAGIGGTGGRQVEWDNLGEEMELRVRGAMLDEGLDILAGLWTGEPFEYKGAYYRMQGHFLPRPAQRPRIPVWIAGVWPHKPPFRRAARWDGIFPLGSDSLFLSPVAIRELCAFIRAHRTDPGPFDVVITGITRAGSREDTDRTAAAFEAGATWWLEWLDGERGSFEQTRERVLQGPPRA